MKSPSVKVPEPPPPPPPPAPMPDPEDTLVKRRSQRRAAMTQRTGRQSTLLSEQPGEQTLGG